MTLPTLVLTGASGFVGRHLLESLAGDYRIFGIARRSQVRCGAPVHPNITWFQVDIGEREPLGEVFRMIRDPRRAPTPSSTSPRTTTSPARSTPSTGGRTSRA